MIIDRVQAIELRDCVDEALAEAQKLDDETRISMGTINWGDLLCCNVEERRSLITGSTILIVTIEEAAPDAVELQDFVGDWLDKHGWPDVCVETEW